MTEPNSGLWEKLRFWRFVFSFVIIVVFVFGAYIAWKYYELELGRQQVEKLSEALKEIERATYEKAMSDTYGGKTPEETLSMYISAVEKGDYDLASKYFIESKREVELNNLKLMEESGNKNIYLDLLKNAKRTKEDASSAYMETAIPDEPSFILQLLKYPNGTWKIEET